MRNWGIVVTAFYALIVTLLLSYGISILADGWQNADLSYAGSMEDMLFGAIGPVIFLVCGQVLLLFLSVDTSWRRMKAQRHATVTAGLIGLMVTILFLAALFAVAMALWGDKADIAIASWFPDSWGRNLSEQSVLVILLASIILIWSVWGVVFYMFAKRASNVVDSAIGWLIKGSVLELLVAVPCHVIVRQREWCCAQYVTAYGIAAGIAIMLMAFGPSALFLYKRKLADYEHRSTEPRIPEE
jgi:hypothetical protein